MDSGIAADTPEAETSLPVAHALGSNQASVSARIPANSTFLWVNGAIGPRNGIVNVKVTPQPPGLKNTDNTYLMFNPYFRECLVFMTPLDPTVEYTFTMAADQKQNTNSFYGTDGITLKSVTYFSIR